MRETARVQRDSRIVSYVYVYYIANHPTPRQASSKPLAADCLAEDDGLHLLVLALVDERLALELLGLRELPHLLVAQQRRMRRGIWLGVGVGVGVGLVRVRVSQTLTLTLTKP